MFGERDPQRRRRLERLSKAELIAEIDRLEAAAGGTSDEDRMLRAIIDASPIMIAVKDPDGRYLTVNAAMGEWFGIDPADAIGRTIHDLVPPDVAEAIAAKDRHVLETGETIPFHEDNMRFEHDERVIRVTKVPLKGPDGHIEGILSITVDVTELRLSEARLRTLLDAAPMPIYFKDRDLRFLVANDRYLALYGVTAEDLIGRTSAEVYPGAMGESFMDHDREVLTQSRVVEREEMIFGVPHVTTKFPVVDSEGRVTGIGGIEADVSRLKEAQEELLLAKEQAELANRAKTEFLANMSHELRTPLNSVIGFAQLIQSVMPPGQEGVRIGEYAGDILNSGRHLLQLIDDILDVSRIELGAFALEEDTIDLDGLIAAGVRMFSVRGPFPDVEVRYDAPAELLKVRGDELRLRQVLLNLVSNAVKFTPEGAVVVSARRSDDGGVAIVVRDTGVGIPPEDVQRVLDPFTRSGGAMTRTREGAGLGLWLSKQLIERHGGQLRLQSTPGEGTTVTLTLPAFRVLEAR